MKEEGLTEEEYKKKYENNEDAEQYLKTSKNSQKHIKIEGNASRSFHFKKNLKKI